MTDKIRKAMIRKKDYLKRGRIILDADESVIDWYSKKSNDLGITRNMYLNQVIKQHIKENS